MKILVLVENYPDLNGDKAMYYVHSRNCYYKNNGIDVDVLNFSANNSYFLDGISVFGITDFKKKCSKMKYDTLLLHAANIKHHYRFIKDYGNRFKNFIFFFHGHEVFRCSKVYPKPFYYEKSENLISRVLRDVYDVVKLKIWRNAFKKYAKKSWFVFVSNWMFDEFKKWVKLEAADLNNRISIIYNCVGEIFEKEKYNLKSEKEYDYVTIRSNFDGSKYCIDVICDLALCNPQNNFYLIGKGDYFKYYEKPQNIILEERQLSHDEIIRILNKSKCALMPTRTDAQGVMACEMATFGIPLITSNIPVCKEVFNEFSNVAFIDNENTNICLDELLKKIQRNETDNKTYFSENTNGKEVELIKKLCKID